MKSSFQPCGPSPLKPESASKNATFFATASLRTTNFLSHLIGTDSGKPKEPEFWDFSAQLELAAASDARPRRCPKVVARDWTFVHPKFEACSGYINLEKERFIWSQIRVCVPMSAVGVSGLGSSAGKRPATATPEPRFKLQKLTNVGCATLEVEFMRPVPGATYEKAKLRIVEGWDEDINDLVLLVSVNGKLQMILPEGPETPWFLDKKQLEESIRKNGARQTLIDVLEYLIHPIESLKQEVSG
jgi:hypothetical protein